MDELRSPRGPTGFSRTGPVGERGSSQALLRSIVARATVYQMLSIGNPPTESPSHDPTLPIDPAFRATAQGVSPLRAVDDRFLRRASRDLIPPNRPVSLPQSTTKIASSGRFAH